MLLRECQNCVTKGVSTVYWFKYTHWGIIINTRTKFVIFKKTVFWLKMPFLLHINVYKAYIFWSFRCSKSQILFENMCLYHSYTVRNQKFSDEEKEKKSFPTLVTSDYNILRPYILRPQLSVNKIIQVITLGSWPPEGCCSVTQLHCRVFSIIM